MIQSVAIPETFFMFQGLSISKDGVLIEKPDEGRKDYGQPPPNPKDLKLSNYNFLSHPTFFHKIIFQPKFPSSIWWQNFKQDPKNLSPKFCTKKHAIKIKWYNLFQYLWFVQICRSISPTNHKGSLYYPQLPQSSSYASLLSMFYISGVELLQILCLCHLSKKNNLYTVYIYAKP